MFAMLGMVEEPIKHLQIIGVVPTDLQVLFIVVQPHWFYPVRIGIIVSNDLEDALLIKGWVSVLFGRFLEFQGVKLLISETEC